MLSIYHILYIVSIDSGKLFNQSWIELDEEINNLQIKKGVTALSHE